MTSINSLKSEISEIFQVLGLSNIATDVYISLIKLGGKGTVRDVISASGISRSLVYKGINELVKIGLVYATAEKPKKYVIVPPNQALGDLLKEKVKALFTSLEHISEVTRSLISSKVLSGETLYSLIEGYENIIRLIHYAIKAAENELLMFIPAYIVERYLVDLIEAKRKGIYVDLTISEAFKEDLKGAKEEILNYASVVRVRPFGSRVLVVADNKVTLLAPLYRGGEGLEVKGLLAEDVELGFILSSYYHGRIANSSLTIKRNFKEGTQYTFTNLGTALDFAHAVKKEGLEALVEVIGIDNLSRKEVKVKGLVYSTIMKPYKGIYSIIINTGINLVSVGGYRSFAEEISAKKIKIKVLSGTPILTLRD